MKGLWFPNVEVNLAKGQTELSIKDTDSGVNEVVDNEVSEDSIHDEMLQSITACPRPLGNLDVPFFDDSSDLGSLMKLGANGLRDGDPGDLQPDHDYRKRRDRRMMMNAHEWDHARSTRGVRAEYARNTLGIEP